MAKTYGPYSPIRKSGNILFVSGQVGLNPETESVPEGVSAQTTQALQNMDAVLHTVGASLSNVVKTTVFLTNMDDFATMNEAYAQMFPEPRPARSAIAIKELPRVPGGKLVVEIEAIAEARTA